MNKPRKDKAHNFHLSETDSPFGEPVEIRLQDSIDLHPFQPKDIPSVVEEYLEQCKQACFHEVRLIHGKGKGVQRHVVQALLQRHPAVDSFHDAPLEAGSWGATVVILKK